MASRTPADVGRSSSPTTTTRVEATRKGTGAHRTKRFPSGNGSWQRTCGRKTRRRPRGLRKSCGPDRKCGSANRPKSTTRESVSTTSKRPRTPKP
eukprot:15156679-Heterocapsa_arctica.AAC.1